MALVETDPNFWESLARAYLGGMRAPSAGQTGFGVVVDTSSQNIEYTDDPSRFAVTLRTATGLAIGDVRQASATATNAATASVQLGTGVQLGQGFSYVTLHVTGRAASNCLVRTISYWVQYLTGPGYVVLATDSAPVQFTNLTSTVALTHVGSGVVACVVSGDSGDGSVLWRATITAVRHAN